MRRGVWGKRVDEGGFEEGDESWQVGDVDHQELVLGWFFVSFSSFGLTC